MPTRPDHFENLSKILSEYEKTGELPNLKRKQHIMAPRIGDNMQAPEPGNVFNGSIIVRKKNAN